MKAYLRQVAIALDQLANALVPGGYADETLSSRAHRMRAKGQRYWGWTANAIDKLFFWQSGHCEMSWLQEVNRQQLHPSFRLPPPPPQQPALSWFFLRPKMNYTDHLNIAGVPADLHTEALAALEKAEQASAGMTAACGGRKRPREWQ